VAYCQSSLTVLETGLVIKGCFDILPCLHQLGYNQALALMLVWAFKPILVIRWKTPRLWARV